MRKLFLLVALLAFVTPALPQAAEETWKGTITDSMCGVKHSADKHGSDATSHKSCVDRCIGRGGEYVFVTDGKPVKIANQSFEGLKTHAAQEVMLTGEMKDGSITVSKIEMPKADKK
jgi:hypothetical protein